MTTFLQNTKRRHRVYMTHCSTAVNQLDLELDLRLAAATGEKVRSGDGPTRLTRVYMCVMKAGLVDSRLPCKPTHAPLHLQLPLVQGSCAASCKSWNLLSVAH